MLISLPQMTQASTCHNPHACPFQAAIRSRGSVVVLCLGGLAALAVPCRGLTLYNFGNPTAEEQLFLELINRARANPPAEGARLAATTDPEVLAAYTYFSVNRTLMQSEFNAIAAQPPLAPNASLTTSARGHSAWMLVTATQAHNETNPANDPFSRMIAAGYSYTSAGENIYASAKSVWYGHAGFEVDWGAGGMIAGRGHRANIHSAAYREIGVGVALGTNGATGPLLVTEDFGVTAANPSFGTGVAYYDLNANNFYDIGEGIAGLTVNISGSDVIHYCTTAAGGGWVVPTPATATTRTVTFSGLNVNQTASLVLPAARNAKADLKLSYAPPAITSAASMAANTPQLLTFTPVGGATAYKWNRWSTSAAAAENCENTNNITSQTTGTYAVLNPSVKYQGGAAFHLENTKAASQWLQLSPLYYAQSSPALSFRSRVRYATSSEQFKVQIKEEGSLVWQDVFSQTGTNGAGETAFSLRTAGLTSMAGKAFRVRFLLNYGGGGYYGTSGDTVGWFMDAITFTGVATLGNNVSQTLIGTSGSFTPASGTYLMSVTPVISSRDYPASYQTLTVSVPVATPPAITSQPAPVTINSGESATLSVTASGTAPTFQWYAGASGDTTFPVADATGTSLTTPPLTSTASYWVRATNTAGSANSNTATVTVNMGFTAWAANLENANDLAAGTIANAPNDDFDHDGRSNLAEYAFGASAVVANDPAPHMPVTQITPTHLVLFYQRDTALNDLTFTALACTALGSWKAPGESSAPSGFTDVVIATDGTLQTRQASVPRTAGNCFLRVRITRP